jgi:metal-responsive CopG/Arc/MetJ family transcriptional regulator
VEDGVPVVLKMPRALRDALDTWADEEGFTSRNELIRVILTDAVKDREPDE